jgi:hypothetical protein
MKNNKKLKKIKKIKVRQRRKRILGIIIFSLLYLGLIWLLPILTFKNNLDSIIFITVFHISLIVSLLFARLLYWFIVE